MNCCGATERDGIIFESYRMNDRRGPGFIGGSRGLIGGSRGLQTPEQSGANRGL